MSEDKPFIHAKDNVLELTLKSVLLSIFLTVILATSNAYLALKVGILTSASIPAAVFSMGILRFFKHSSVLENNLVQTAASAGEAVAGGIVYTIPALVIIQYWYAFGFWQNFFIAAIGGTLGVIFSVPLRRMIVHEPSLPFPEARAIAEVLKASETGTIVEMAWGGLVGALMELLQVGFKLISGSFQVWFLVKRAIVGFGVGFSATMIGAGYLIGFELAFSILIGALIGWLIAVPLASLWYPNYAIHYPPGVAVVHLWNAKIRYVGIGAMLFAGIWSFIKMLKPLTISFRRSFTGLSHGRLQLHHLKRTERDIPLIFVLVLISLFSAILFVFFQTIFPIDNLGFDFDVGPSIVFICVIYVLVMGFLFAAITGFFSGMVGVTASPGSSIIIGGMLLVASVLYSAMHYFLGPELSVRQLQSAEAITIIIGSVITGIAAIANDNAQDLKVGQLLGATPWKQQLMLLLGVLVSALIIPFVMQLLFDVYGIAGQMPRPGMDSSNSLPAPPAALMAAITQAVFNHGLPWTCLGIGILLMAILALLSSGLKKVFNFRLSILGMAIGMYLPMSTSVPIFLGGLIAWITQKGLAKKSLDKKEMSIRKHRGLLLACGLVAGAALMEVILAVPFSLSKKPYLFRLDAYMWDGSSLLIAIILTFAIFRWFYYLVCDKQ